MRDDQQRRKGVEKDIMS